MYPEDSKSEGNNKVELRKICGCGACQSENIWIRMLQRECTHTRPFNPNTSTIGAFVFDCCYQRARVSLTLTGASIRRMSILRSRITRHERRAITSSPKWSFLRLGCDRRVWEKMSVEVRWASVRESSARTAVELCAATSAHTLARRRAPIPSWKRREASEERGDCDSLLSIRHHCCC